MIFSKKIDFFKPRFRN